MSIKKVAVIGAGLMGSGIAAQIANAGYPVILLDIVPKDADDRSVIAKSAIQKMLKADPAPFMLPSNAKLITPGNLEDDLELPSEGLKITVLIVFVGVAVEGELAGRWFLQQRECLGQR